MKRQIFGDAPKQTFYMIWELVLDGILMDIMVENGEIWCKFSVSVMVYIH